nr:transcription factor-like protein DPB isoform X3 [Ipomoea batatas]
MSSYIAPEILQVVVWLYHLYWFRLVLMQLLKWKYQKICNWCTLTLTALPLSCMMIIMSSRQ